MNEKIKNLLEIVRTPGAPGKVKAGEELAKEFQKLEKAGLLPEPKRMRALNMPPRVDNEGWHITCCVGVWSIKEKKVSVLADEVYPAPLSTSRH